MAMTIWVFDDFPKWLISLENNLFLRNCIWKGLCLMAPKKIFARGGFLNFLRNREKWVLIWTLFPYHQARDNRKGWIVLRHVESFVLIWWKGMNPLMKILNNNYRVLDGPSEIFEVKVPSLFGIEGRTSGLGRIP